MSVERDSVSGNILDQLDDLRVRVKYLEDTHSGIAGESADTLAHYRPGEGGLFTPGDITAAGDIVAGDDITSGGLLIATTTPAARVYNNANISISNSTWEDLTFNSELWDTDSIHSTVSNTDRLTCQTAGWYVITGHVTFDSNNTGYRSVGIRWQGTDLIAVHREDAVASVDTIMSVATVIKLAVSQYVTLRVFQNSGGALNVNRDSRYSPEFMMVRVV